MTYYVDRYTNGSGIAGSGNGSFATDGSHATFHYLLLFYTFVDLPLQGYVAFLILRIATETLKEYRFFMLLCAMWDFCLSMTVGFVMQPRSLQPLSQCIAVQGPAAWLSHTGALVSFVLVIFTAAAMVLTQDYCLAYRLTLVTSRAANETFMRPATIASALGSLYILAVGIAYAASRMFDPHGENYVDDLLRTEYILDDNVSLACFDFTSIAAMQYLMYAAVAIIALVAASQTYCVIVAVIIFRRLKASLSVLSERSRNMHSQLTRLLLFQTFTPFICFLIPITACCFVIISAAKISPIYIYIGVMSIATFPKINALLTITFVAPYRKYTWKRLRISDQRKTSIIEMISSHAWEALVMWTLLLTAAVCLLSTTLARDRTTESGATGTDVVYASISRLQGSCIFPNDYQFLRRLAWVESSDGTKTSFDVQSGLWGSDDYVLRTVQGSSGLVTVKGQLAADLNVTVDTYQWSAGDMEVPIASAAVARAKLFAANQKLPMALSEQAAFWAQNYHQGKRNATDFINKVNTLPACNAPGIDLMFVVDSSGSIGSSAFEDARKFLITVMQGLTIGDQATRVGIIAYSSSVQVVSRFSGDSSSLIRAAQNMPFMGRTTQTGPALTASTNEFSLRGRDQTQGHARVTVLITDGVPDSQQDAMNAADAMKAAGITLFTLGIGSANLANLKNTASNPKCLRFYLLNDYANLAQEFPEVLLSETCTVAATIPPTVQNVSSTVRNGQCKFFDLSANVSDGMTLKLFTQVGDTTNYVSLTNRLPSSADYDYKANAPQGSVGQIFVSPNALQNVLPSSSRAVDTYKLSDVRLDQQGKVVTVFSAVCGHNTTNNFTMNSDPGDTLITTQPTTPTTTKALTTPAPTKEDSACACNISNIWLDIYVVIDVSTSMSQHGLDDAGNFLAGIFDQIKVQPGVGQHSRVSIITYADTATLIGDLNKFDNSALDTTLPYLNCSTSGSVNILSALQTVGQMSDNQGKYPRRRPVALILGTALNQDTSSDAIHAAGNLKSAGFEIVTIACNAQDGADSAQPIGLLASPGLNFSNSDSDALTDQLTKAFCQANCFCLSPWNQWKTPGTGSVVERLSECLQISDFPSNSAGAKRYCRRNGAYLVSEFSDAKHDYVLDVALRAYPNARRFLIGLSRQNGEYVWMSKNATTIPLTVSDYINWNDGFPKPKSGDCVAEVKQSGNTTKWESFSCLYLQHYVCQKAAFDTDNYLP